MDPNKGRYVGIQLILVYDYHNFSINNVNESTGIKMASFECPNNLKFRTVAIKLEQRIFGYTTNYLDKIEFKFNYDVMKLDEVLYDVGLKEPSKMYFVWFFAPHFSLASAMMILREHQEEKERKDQEKIDSFLLKNEYFNK